MTGYFLEGPYTLAVTPPTLRARPRGDVARGERGPKPADLPRAFLRTMPDLLQQAPFTCTSSPHVTKESFTFNRKMFLPTYGVFDEERFLSARASSRRFRKPISGEWLSLLCEDACHAITATLAAVKGRAECLSCRALSRTRSRSGGTTRQLSRNGATRCDWPQIEARHLRHLRRPYRGFEGGKGMTGSSFIVDPRGASSCERRQRSLHYTSGSRFT